MPSYLPVQAPAGSYTTTNASSYTLVNTPSEPNDFADLEDKSPAQQVEALKEMLVVQNRIKEGAQNLLNMRDLSDTLREQVMSELDMAQEKIESVQKRIDTLSENKPKLNVSSSTRRRFLAEQAGRSPRDDADDKSREDFRTALNNASSCVRSLTMLNRGNIASPTGGSSSSTSAVNSTELDRQRVEILTQLVSILQRNLRVRYELNITDVMQAVIPALADKASQKCRAAAYRLIRHTLIDADSMKRIGEQTLDWYIIKSLTRDNKYTMEKEQVIKLIRTIVEVGTVRNENRGAGGSGTVPLSAAVMRAFVAVAEHAEDPFRLICIQTLGEILIVDTDLVARTGGIRFLLHALGEGPLEVAPILASAFLHIVDSPRTRAYLQVGADLEMAFSAVTDAYGKGPDHADRMRGCTKVIQLMLRTWSGLMYFCMDNMRAIRSLIDTLRIPSLDTREIILDMFFDLLSIKTPEWYQTFIDGRRLTMYRKTRESREQRRAHVDTPERSPETLKLTDQYIALMVLVFTNAGLLDALTGMMEESTSGSNLSRKATLLMAEVLQMANRVLPLSVAAQIQTIPRIFSMASDYSHGENRIVGTSAMSAIDSFNRNQTRLEPNAVKGARPRANSAEDAIRRGQRQIEQVKLKMSMQMDDKTFQSSLLETQVMLTKDHTVWKFDLLQELIEGPLLNPKRLEEAIKVSRFIRRLLSFFHPFGNGIKFCDLPRIKANQRWVKLGCSLLTTLTASPDGVRYLSTEDPFFTQIVKSFAQLDPLNAVPDVDPVFSKRRVSSQLTYGYLVMLGTLSKTKEGIELLQKFKIFTAFYHFSELKDREDLVKGIIENLDYSIDGHSRIVLSKTLTSGFAHIRLYATRHLGDLIRTSATAHAWMLRLLLTQLYDPEPSVAELAVTYLRDACQSKDILQLVVEMQPTLDHLGEIGHPLLLKFVSTPVGFRYLYDVGYITQEMDTWFHERNIYYVVQVEVFLAKVFRGGSRGSDHDDETLAFEGTVPPHFYGEMAKTDLGCQILHDKGHFSEFAEFIRLHNNESDDTELILKLKSILWAVGNIGATEGGLPFLEEEEIIPTVLDIAQNSPIPSVRGTCFFVLGLISSTSQGAEILDDYRWEATLSPLGLPTGLCIPIDLELFISLPPWVQQTPDRTEGRLVPPVSQTELDVITAIHNLANTVIANAASRSLARMKSRPEFKSIFASPAMFFRALHTVSTQRYRLPVRRYIMDLFTIQLDADVVAALSEAAKNMKASPSFKPSKESNRVSMFGPLGRPRRSSESDDEAEIDVDDEPLKPPVGEQQPAISLRPVSRIVGFDI
ncbi:Rapamycin-insensitive companion of mTOR, N-term-domain-containing protein [Favolaschia claudopus]|uniref:Rapamycin-insensitive companion of mTOR, N-term-domain-containing protein n=1 Tax=Favolaschia claudopus TaxID=2862362 RepID=A0AAW0DB47_9AGAR